MDKEMDKEAVIRELEELSNAPGAPGFEEAVVDLLEAHTADLGRQERDSLLNFYVFPPEDENKTKPILLLDAHLDEVAFVVQSILPNGMISFLPLGSWVPANVAAQRVKIRTLDGHYVDGVVASKPPHYMTQAEQEAPPHLDHMLVDVGADSAEDAMNRLGIHIGAPIVPGVTFTPLDDRGNLFLGKAFDNRVGCVAVSQVLKHLKDKDLEVSPVAAYASQEEVGIRGAEVTTKKVQAAVAICFEGSPADDTFGSGNGAPPQTALGKGPMLRHIDISMITNPRYMRFVLDLAQELDIPVQEAVRSGGGTNAAAIQLSGEGVPVIVMGIPVRYAHSHHSICDYRDLEQAIRLSVAIAERLDEETIRSF